MKTPILIAGLLLGALSGCSSPSTGGSTPTSPAAISTTVAPTPTPAAEPMTTDAAKAAAQEFFDRHTSGDFAGAWELYSDEGKAAITQADYVRFKESCPGVQGIKVKIVSVRLQGATAIVRIEALGLTVSYTLKYEHGQWLMQPDKETMADYATGVDAMIKSGKNAGTC